MPLPDSPAFHLPPPTLPRRGMRGGLQRAAHAAARAAVPTDGTGPDGRRQQQRPAERLLSSYWAGAWKVAALVTAVLVIRLAEVVPRLSLVRPTVLVLLIAFLMHSSRSRPAAWRRVWQDGQLRRALGYVAVALATVPFALWKIPAISAVQGMVFDVGLIVILLLCPPTLLTVDRLLTAFPLLTSVYAVATIAAGRVVEGDRVTTSGMYDPNDLGALFCIALPMALALLLRAGLLKKALGLVCAAVLAYGIIRTGSRGGMLGMAAGVLTLLLGFNIRRFVPRSRGTRQLPRRSSGRTRPRRSGAARRRSSSSSPTTTRRAPAGACTSGDAASRSSQRTHSSASVPAASRPGSVRTSGSRGRPAHGTPPTTPGSRCSWSSAS
jgi:hypothetical protein